VEEKTHKRKKKLLKLQDEWKIEMVKFCFSEKSQKGN